MTLRDGHPGRSILLGVTAAVALTFVGVSTVDAVEPKGQAPALAELVKSGALPPLAERLPKNPVVLEPAEAVGQYGGTLETLISGAGERAWIKTIIGYDHLVRWNPSIDRVIPNLAESWETNDGGKTYVFKLREGVKWSDGEPFTSEDIVFWWNDVASNDKLPPEYRSRAMRVKGDITVEAIDPNNVRFKFTNPHGMFPKMLATMEGEYLTSFPAHYLKPFLPKYNPDADANAKKAGFSGWAAMFEEKANQWINPEKPTIFAWQITSPLTDTRLVSAKRNPYYWKIDTEGNQLPYIDQVDFAVVPDKEVMLLKTLSGEVDYLPRYINTFANKPVVVENEQRGDYQLFDFPTSDFNYTVVHLNLTSPDAKLREMFNNKKFRIGLSYAIDREEIIDLVFAGQGKPYQVGPRPESIFYHERLATEHTAFDPDLANKYLDEAGFDKRNSSGVRLRPDGEPVTFVISVREDRQYMVDIMELVVQHWQRMGVDAKSRVVEKSRQRALRNNNQHEATVDDGEGGLTDAMIEPRAWLPVSRNSAWGIGWYLWLQSEGQKGEAPPPYIQSGLDLYNQVIQTSDQDKQVELFMKILDEAADNFLSIGVGLPEPGYGIASNRLQNVPERVFKGWMFGDSGPANPAQFAIKR